MAHAYTPGLTVSPRHQHRVIRTLPIPGEVLASVGDRVEARQVVAETFMPGDITPVNLANALSVPPGDVPDLMLKREGDAIAVGDAVARTKGIFGLMKTEYKSKVAGTIESISHVTGQLIVRGEPESVQVRAYLSGEVVEVIEKQGVAIEAEVAFVQGIFGVGGETFGALKLACASHEQELAEDLIHDDMKDRVIVGGGRVTAAAIRKAVDVGAAAIVTGGIDDQDLKDFLGYDLGVAITGSEQVGLTLIVTEGFGDISMAPRTFDLLKSHEGDDAAVNGATQIRAGVMRPEIIVPLVDPSAVAAPQSDREAGALGTGSSVRIIRDPYFGLIGAVAGLPAAPQALASGSKARILEVELEEGGRVVVPRANVELIEEG